MIRGGGHKGGNRIKGGVPRGDSTKGGIQSSGDYNSGG